MALLEWSWYGNSLRSLLLAVLLAVVVYLVLRFARVFLVKQFTRLDKRTDILLGDIWDDALSATRGWFIVLVSLWAGEHMLAMSEPLRDRLDQLIILVLLFQIALWGSAAIRSYAGGYTQRRIEQDAASVTMIKALAFATTFALWAVLFLMGIANLGFDVTTLIAGLGVGGIAIALAVQSILGDLLASLSIVFDKPFVYGDFIAVDNLLGTVENIGLKTTRLRSLSGEQLVFSNSDLLASRIHNYARMQDRRVVFQIGVTYDTPRETLARIPAMIRATIEALPDTRFDRAHFVNFGPSALQLETVYYVLTPDYTLYMDRQQAINLGIMKLFEAEGIQFAFPTQTLLLSRSPAGPSSTGDSGASGSGGSEATGGADD